MKVIFQCLKFNNNQSISGILMGFGKRNMDNNGKTVKQDRKCKDVNLQGHGFNL